jgi:hypothetical protein
MKAKSIIYIVLLMLSLVSCVEERYDFDKLDSKMEISTKLVGPIAYSKLSVIKIIDFLNLDSIGSLDFQREGDTMYLVKEDKQYLGNELVNQLKVLPSTLFDLRVPIALLTDLDATSAEIDHKINLIFQNINTNENERLDSILMGHSYIDVNISFPKRLIEGSHLKISFNEEELLLNPDLYPENAIDVQLADIYTTETSTYISEKIDIYGAMLRLKGENTISVSFVGEVFTDEEIDLDNIFEISLDCSNMRPHVTFMNIGNARDIVENEKEIDFDYAQDVYDIGMYLPFYDPEILMTCHNNIGVPARYYIDYVEGICTSTGEKETAEFGEDDYISLVLNAPLYDEIQGLSHKELLNFNVDNLTKQSQLILNRENGRTDKLFKIKVDKLRYKYRIRSEETDRSKVHFFFQDSDIELKEVTKLPLWFEGDRENLDKNFRITRQDTVDVDLSSLILEGLSAVKENSIGILKFYYKNHLQLAVDAKVKFLDENNQEIMQSSYSDFLIESAEVDGLGNVIRETEPKEMLLIPIYDEDLEDFLNKKVKMVFDYTLRNEKQKNIFLKASDWLEMKVMFHLDADLVIDPKNKYLIEF